LFAVSNALLAVLLGGVSVGEEPGGTRPAPEEIRGETLGALSLGPAHRTRGRFKTTEGFGPGFTGQLERPVVAVFGLRFVDRSFAVVGFGAVLGGGAGTLEDRAFGFSACDLRLRVQNWLRS
jgi:hypothetical protein